MIMWRIVVTFLTCILIFSTHASTNIDHQQQLAVLINDLKYDLEVNWDQVNRDDYKKIINQFNLNISALIDQGVSIEEIIGFVRENTLDPESREALEITLTNIKVKNLSREEAANLVLDQLSQNSPTGSHWVSSGKIVALVVIATIMVISTLVVLGQMGKVKQGGTGGSDLICRDRYVCIDYYDVDGYKRTSCGWETYCF